MTIETLAILIAVVVVGYRLAVWLAAPVAHASPNPWGPDVEQTLQDPELPEICHRCLTPQPPAGWFCPTCGASVGPYNNYMPFIYVFSQGEVFRAGATAHIRRSPLTVVGYVLCSMVSYTFFAPFYWYRLFQNLGGRDAETGDESLSDRQGPSPDEE